MYLYSTYFIRPVGSVVRYVGRRPCFRSAPFGPSSLADLGAGHRQSRLRQRWLPSFRAQPAFDNLHAHSTPPPNLDSNSTASLTSRTPRLEALVPCLPYTETKFAARVDHQLDFSFSLDRRSIQQPTPVQGGTVDFRVHPASNHHSRRQPFPFGFCLSDTRNSDPPLC